MSGRWSKERNEGEPNLGVREDVLRSEGWTGTDTSARAPSHSHASHAPLQTCQGPQLVSGRARA